MRVLIIGHLSTIGDLACLDVVSGWLARAGVAMAVAPLSRRLVGARPGWQDIRSVDAGEFTHVIAVCGPFWRDHLLASGVDLGRFAHCRRIGLNLSMVESLAAWNPFDLLLERDSDRLCRPDLAMLHDPPAVPPVVGRCLIERQPEYGRRQRHAAAIGAIDGLIGRAGLAAIDLDTRWLRPGNPLSTPERFQAVLGRVDVLLTNRLHGLVLGLRAGIPVIAIDPVAGGAKILAQAAQLGWPLVATAEQATPAWLDAALARCLDPRAKDEAAACRARAAASLGDLEGQVLAELASGAAPGRLPRSGVPFWLAGVLARLRARLGS